jgi:diaminopimelate decarboxylase
VLLEKEGEARRFLVLDAAMNDLLRPSLYDAWHDVVPVGDAAGRQETEYDVVGPVCETGDTFATGRRLPRCEAGDLVAILGTGAYGASMASTYNSRPLAAEVLVDGDRYAVVRRRQTLDEMIGGEQPAAGWKTA